MSSIKSIHKFIWRIAFCCLLFFFITFLCVTFKEDEEVTMGFMEHNFYNIVNINSLDVHPPMYYILLKIFLMICTFWTKSIFIKTIFARIFSIILFIITLIYLRKIFNLSGIKVNIRLQFLIFCFMPAILEVATHIRMYQLATLCITLEYYGIIKFMNYNKYSYLILSIIFASFVAYVHYYVAIIAGIIFLIFLIESLITKYYEKALAFLISGIVFILLCLPLLPYVLSQMINRGRFPNANAGIINQTISSLIQLTASDSILKEIFDIILIALVISLSVYLIKHVNNQKIINRMYELIFSILLSILVELVISIVYRPFFECRFIFPLISIYFFFLIGIFLYLYDLNYISFGFIFKAILIGVVILIGVSDISKIHQNIMQYDVPSIQLINRYNKWKKSKNKLINTNANKYPTQFQEALYATQNSVYLKSLHKDAIVNNSNKTNLSKECNGNTKFVHKLFTNLYNK